MSTTVIDQERPHERASTTQRLKSIFGGSVGNLVEWYDWYTYSACAIYFAPVFFPSHDPTIELLNTAAVFAVGFLMRPIGGWVLGRYADRYGRKPALTLSVILMCSGSLIIAVTPGYETLGAVAPGLLLLARLLQGFSVGGEYGTSATYMTEIATPGRRGFYSAVVYVTLIMGQLLSLSVLLVLQVFVFTDNQLRDWAWRLPFLLGALAALVALYLRRALEETESFRNAQKQRQQPAGALTLLTHHPREVLTVIGLTMGGTLFFYVFTTYMQQYLVNTVGLTKTDATLVSASSLLVFMLLQPLVGALSDRIGRRPVLIAFGVLALLGTVPLLTALERTSDALTAFCLVTVGLAIASLYSSISAIVKAELFPAEIRALGVGLPHAIAASLFGGSAPYLALWFKSIGHEGWFYWFVTACAFGSLLVYLFMRPSESADRSAGGTYRVRETRQDARL
jgi:MHS family alpha-ketoglutarate permease-like MFS transporter